MSRRWGVCLVLAVASAASIRAGAVESTEPRRSELTRPLSERQPLVAGVNIDSFPYSFLDHQGNWTGFSAELLDAVTRVMQLRIVRAAGTAPELDERFRNGEFDLTQALGQSPERERYAEFSVPFLTLQCAIFVRKSSPTITAVQDLNGKRFAILDKGSIGDRLARDNHLRMERVYVSSVEAALRAVDRGECDAALASQLTALSVIERRGLRNVRMLDWSFPDYDIRHCFAVHKGDAQLLARLNEGLAILQRNGEFRRIYDRWFGRFESPKISRDQVIAYGIGLLIVALAATVFAYLRQRRLRLRILRQTEELAGHQALLQALYDNLPYAICLLEIAPRGRRVLSTNRQADRFLGVSSREASGRFLEDLPMDREWARAIESLLRRAGTSAELMREECRLEKLHLQTVLTLVPLAPGPEGHVRLCLLAEDVTERHQLDQEISQSRKLRAVGELVGGIAHEFNNLLTPVMLKTGEMRLEWGRDQRLLQEIDLIADVVKRAADLTRRLLTFGRKTDVHAEPVRLATVVDNCFALLRPTVDRRIVWENALARDLPALFLRPTDVNQIVINLVLNGRDTLMDKLAGAHAGWTPTIRVEAVQLPLAAISCAPGSVPQNGFSGWQRLTVRDNGMGMEAEARERLFEPFFTTKEIGRGTGLGLAIVWQLVHEAGGRIEVESKLGEGTAFHVFLPVAPVPADFTAPAGPGSRAKPGQARILLVEDDDLVAMTIGAVLRRAGHSVQHESDGMAAWRHLETRFADYDLVLLDLNMPGLNGLELTQRIRAAARYKGSLIIISGRVDAEQMRELSDLKVTSVLNKPFEIAELQSAVSRVLECGGRTE